MKTKVMLLVLLLVFSFSLAIFAETPQPGGSLVIVLGVDPEHINPAITTSYPTGAVAASVYSALLWRDESGRPRPELAKDWVVSEDFLTYTFNLRNDVKWHDGKPFTSADVKFTMEEILAPNHGRFQTAFAHVESITAPDDYTIVLQLKNAYAPLINLLTVFDAPILPKHIYEGADALSHQANRAPIGTGPFMFRDWVNGERIVLVRNPEYFEGPAYLDSIIFRTIPQDAARSIALEVGDADLLWGFYLASSDIERLANHPGLEVWQGVRIPSLYFMFMNTNRPGLQDVRVRKALMHAIDRDQIVEQAMMGLGDIAGGPFGSGFEMAFDPATSYGDLYPFSPETARQLLAEAGVSDLRLNLVYDAARQPFAVAAEIIRDNLRQVGVSVVLQPAERSVMLDLTYTRGEYDLSMQSFTSSGDPAIGYHRIYATAAPGTPFVNATGYSNSEVDSLLYQASSIPDFDIRAQLYDQIAAILAEDVPVFVMFDELSTEVNHKDLRGLRESLDVRDRLQSVWWKK